MRRGGHDSSGTLAGVLAKALAGVCVVALAAGCQVNLGGSGGAQGDIPPEITDNEGGPESLIIDGLTVPDGAVQLGPLARYRSDRMIAAYTPELTAALTMQGVTDAVTAAGNNPDGVRLPTPPAITKNARPDDDTFALLEDPPPADVTAAVIRLDADQTQAVQSVVSQIATLLPESGVDPSDFTSYCTLIDDRVSGCSLQAEGTTDDRRHLSISMDVDPGNLDERVAAPASQTQPVMLIHVEDLSDPRMDRAGISVDDSPSAVQLEPPVEPDDVVWPRMDVEAESDTPLLDGTWVAPSDATILLSSFTPGFVSLSVPSSARAREIARDYAQSMSADGTAVQTDSYEGLNEVDVTFRATTADGAQASATHVITARGNYVMLFYTPAS